MAGAVSPLEEVTQGNGLWSLLVPSVNHLFYFWQIFSCTFFSPLVLVRLLCSQLDGNFILIEKWSVWHSLRRWPMSVHSCHHFSLSSYGSMDTTLIHTHTHIVNVVSGTKVHALHLASEAATPCPQQLAAMCQERGSAGKINLDGPTISCLPRRPYHQLCTPAGLSLNSITHRNTHTKHTLVALPAWPCPKPWITALMPA